MGSKAAAAGVACYDKWMRPLWNMAEQRHVASLYDISPAALDAVEFADMIDMNTSTPIRRTAADRDW